MKRCWMVCLAVLIALANVGFATDWDEMKNRVDDQDDPTINDRSLDTCTPDFIVAQIPYHNSTNLAGAGNDCSIRSSADHIYQITIPVAGEYSFSLCASTAYWDSRIYLKTTCCSGPNVATNDEGCGPLGHASIECIFLDAQIYYLMVEAETPGIESFYTIDITSCSDPCRRAFVEDGTFPNQDGSFTFVQTTDENDAHSPVYDGPFPAGSNPCVDGMREYGFEIYSWYDQDYGWRHIWPGYNMQTGVCVQSVQLILCAYDVDQSDCSRDHPENPSACELDRIYGDDELLSPNYLQGANGVWSVTVFDVPPSALLDDGVLNCFIDIDVYNNNCTWATSLNYAQLVVRFRNNLCNEPPFTPELSGAPCITDDSTICVSVIGPSPADPDGDGVTYSYRWFVRNPSTNGGFVDDEQIGPDHNGPCVPPADTHLDDEWLVQVYAFDDHGTQSLEAAQYFFPVVIQGPCGPPEPLGWDLGDLFVDTCEVGYPLGTAEQGGPAHRVFADNLAWLGRAISVETNPQIPNLDTGDDGIEFVGRPWMPCTNVCVNVTVTTGPAYNGQPLYLYGWKDGNLNCSWNDVLCDGQASECIIGGLPVVDMSANDSRTFEVCFADPGVLTFGRYDGLLRFRLMSSNPGCLEAQAGVDNVLGEVEDYVIEDLQLDVELLSFAATYESAESGAPQVAVRWSTASESQNDHFDLERMVDQEWYRVSQIHGAGTSVETHQYSYVDHDIARGMSYRYRLVAVDVSGNRVVQGETQVEVSADGPAVVSEFKLYNNFPNPFNPSTTITFDLKAAGWTKLSVFDVLGREVAVLVNSEMEAGRHQIEFRGDGLTSGLYLYRLEAPGFADMRKMMLLK